MLAKSCAWVSPNLVSPGLIHSAKVQYVGFVPELHATPSGELLFELRPSVCAAECRNASNQATRKPSLL